MPHVGGDILRQPEDNRNSLDIILVEMKEEAGRRHCDVEAERSMVKSRLTWLRQSLV